MLDSLDWLFDAFALFLLLALLVLGVVVVLWLGALPGNVARKRGHPQSDAISVCGWLGLLFALLWPVALVWAYTRPATAPPASDPAARPGGDRP